MYSERLTEKVEYQTICLNFISSGYQKSIKVFFQNTYIYILIKNSRIRMVPTRGTNYQMEKVQLCISKLCCTAHCKQLRHYFVTFTKLNIHLHFTRCMTFSVQTLFTKRKKRFMKHVTTLVDALPPFGWTEHMHLFKAVSSNLHSFFLLILFNHHPLRHPHPHSLTCQNRT